MAVKCYTVTWGHEREGIDLYSKDRIGALGNYARIGDGIFEDEPIWDRPPELHGSDHKGVIVDAGVLPPDREHGDFFPILTAPREDDPKDAVLVMVSIDWNMSGELISVENDGVDIEDQTLFNSPYIEGLLVMPVGSKIRWVYERGRISLKWDGIRLSVVRQ